MDRNIFEQVYATAHDIRLMLEYYAEDADFSKDLSGLCAIASGELHARLKRNGISSTIVLYEGIGYGHCFVEVENHVVDITATQFGEREKVCVKPVEEARAKDFWNSVHRFNSVKTLKKYQRKIGWPQEQVEMQCGWKC